MFTQQHYTKIAETLREVEKIYSSLFPLYGLHSRKLPSPLVKKLVVLFASDNHKFSTKKFLNAIYGKEEI